MKKYFLLLVAFAFTSCATIQTVSVSPNDDLIKVYEDVNGSKDQLFLKSNEWMVNSFVNAGSVIQYSDKEEGAIIGKYLMGGQITSGLYGISNDTRVFAIIDIRVKDNKARILIKPAGPWKYDPSGLTIYSFSPEDFEEYAIKLQENFHASLKKESVNF